MNRKTIYLTLLTLTLITASFGYVKADTVLDQDLTEDTTYDNVIVAGWAYALRVAGNGQYISSVSFKWHNHTALTTGTIQAHVWADDMHTPNNTLVSSDTLNFADCPGDEYYNFTFTDNYPLLLGTYYYIGWRIMTAPNAAIDFSAHAAVCNAHDVSDFAGSFTTYTTKTFNHIFYTRTDYIDTTPAPTATVNPPTDTEQLFIDLTAFLTPVLVMMLPALILWWFGGKGKWPLLIGLAIGTGLGYVFITGFPLWLVFLVAIGIIGMAYSDVSGGGAYT